MKLAALATALLVPLAALAQDKPAAKGAAKDKEPPLAKVNGVAVPASYLEFMMQQQRGRGTPDNPQTRQMMRDELVNREIVSQEAQRQGLGKDPEVQTQLAVARQANVISAAAAAQLSTRSAQTARLLHGYLLYVERQLEGAAARAG
jgi:peptidyl-prolyl cis-trans isomerase C